VQFTLSGEAHEKLRRVQDLLRHSIPDGDPAAIFERALTLLLNNLEMQKLAAVARPRPARSARSGSERSRHVPSAVRRAVWARDEGRCAFVGTNGRCGERGFLEFHHVVPFADGGGSTVENLQLRCRAHNAYEAKLYFELSVVREAKATYGSARSGPSPAGPSFFSQQGATGCVSASLGMVITAPQPFLGYFGRYARSTVLELGTPRGRTTSCHEMLVHLGRSTWGDQRMDLSRAGEYLQYRSRM
jgi:hypothetical protein